MRPGDALLVSGPIGDHEIAVMSAREGLEFQTALVSDSAPLSGLVSAMFESGGRIRCMRDPTRGGVATILNELGRSGGAEIVVEDAQMPVCDAVRAACEILGLDPLYVASEGTLVAIVADEDQGRVLAAMRRHPLGVGACRIGTVTASGNPRVLLHTAFGTTRYLEQLSGSQLPRIC
jgi:hydrogenase expression/formation protein HypE